MQSHVEALQETVGALHLGSEHAALVATLEHVAAALDLSPGRTTLIREYRPLLRLLYGLAEPEDTEHVAFLELVRPPVPKARG